MYYQKEITENIKSVNKGPVMLVVKVMQGSRKQLTRPTITPVENKNAFMDHLKS
tara:strand:- start:588 stop:749 length:162 start_codon:yes stop_codon:yes gene_type:complete